MRACWLAGNWILVEWVVFVIIVYLLPSAVPQALGQLPLLCWRWSACRGGSRTAPTFASRDFEIRD